MTADAEKDGGKLDLSWRFRRGLIGGAAALVDTTADAGVVKSLARFAVGVVDAARRTELNVPEIIWQFNVRRRLNVRLAKDHLAARFANAVSVVLKHHHLITAFRHFRFLGWVVPVVVHSC